MAKESLVWNAFADSPLRFEFGMQFGGPLDDSNAVIAHTKCGAGTLAGQDHRTSSGTSAMLGIEKAVECFCFHSINRSVKKIPDRLNQLSLLVVRLKYARTRKIERQYTAMIPEHDTGSRV